MKKSLSLIALIGMIACNDKQSNTSPKYELLKNNKANLIIDMPDYILVNEEGCVNITNINKEYKIEGAYIDCSKDSIKDINFETKSLIGCSKRLYIENDTVMICFKPQAKKEYSHNVVVLLSSNDQFYVYDTSYSIISK